MEISVDLFMAFAITITYTVIKGNRSRDFGKRCISPHLNYKRNNTKQNMIHVVMLYQFDAKGFQII